MIHKTQDPKKRPPNFKRDLRKVGWQAFLAFLSDVVEHEVSHALRRTTRTFVPASGASWKTTSFNRRSKKKARGRPGSR